VYAIDFELSQVHEQYSMDMGTAWMKKLGKAYFISGVKVEVMKSSKAHSWTSSKTVSSRAAGVCLVSNVILRRCGASEWRSPPMLTLTRCSSCTLHHPGATWILQNHVSDLENVEMESLGLRSAKIWTHNTHSPPFGLFLEIFGCNLWNGTISKDSCLH
jgi:hypothetical protein